MIYGIQTIIWALGLVLMALFQKTPKDAESVAELFVRPGPRSLSEEDAFQEFAHMDQCRCLTQQAPLQSPQRNRYRFK